MTRYHVWASELRTLDIEVDAANAEEAERQLRRRLASNSDRGEWLSSALVIKVGRGHNDQSIRSEEAAERPRKLLTTQAAAEALGIGRTTVFALIKAGELKTVSVGRRRLVSNDALDEYVKARTQ